MTDITPRRLVEMMIETSRELDAAQAELVGMAQEDALKASKARRVRARAYLATEGTVGVREALTDQEAGTAMYEAHLAKGLHQSALEAVRNKRAQLSALQSIASSVRAEAELAKYGPEVA